MSACLPALFLVVLPVDHSANSLPSPCSRRRDGSPRTDAVMDIYAMYACISRASKSLKEGNKSAEHEVLLTTTFCMEAKERVKNNLHHMTTGSTQLDKNRVRLGTLAQALAISCRFVAGSLALFMLRLYPVRCFSAATAEDRRAAVR